VRRIISNHDESFGETAGKNGNMRLLYLIGLAFSFLASPAIAGNFDEAEIAYYRELSTECVDNSVDNPVAYSHKILVFPQKWMDFFVCLNHERPRDPAGV
jgi:hypothetical protein